MTNHTADYSPMMAGLVLGIIPVLTFYLLGQKYIIEGVISGSVKG
jgi:raffinose/stachyose/melibiose transport system permease protein